MYWQEMTRKMKQRQINYNNESNNDNGILTVVIKLNRITITVITKATTTMFFWWMSVVTFYASLIKALLISTAIYKIL